MKIKLVGGPFTGRSVEWLGGDTIAMAGPKRETRAQRYQRQAAADPLSWSVPQVRATYSQALVTYNGQVIPCVHPSGAMMFKYNNDKTEY